MGYQLDVKVAHQLRANALNTKEQTQCASHVGTWLAIAVLWKDGQSACGLGKMGSRRDEFGIEECHVSAFLFRVCALS